jgi:phosphoribosylformylglycinamidine synthase
MRNAGLKYICKLVHLRVETADSGFTNQLTPGDVLQIPIGHMEGNYFCTPEVLRELEAEDRIAFRYSTPGGEITAEANPNGSLSNIAGILNSGRNVLGMMPHPDRSSDKLLGSSDGWKIFASMVEALATR